MHNTCYNIRTIYVGKVGTIDLKGKDLVKLLEKNGWVTDRINGSHHILKKSNKTTIVPVHSTDIGTGLLDKILKQAGLK
jgi:predicted RNA binding protein YcfA (HicA-like mRNA interferase family)